MFIYMPKGLLYFLQVDAREISNLNPVPSVCAVRLDSVNTDTTCIIHVADIM